MVGAGIGGLAVAGRLRRAGFEVTVLEKNDHAGGRCDTLQWRGHRFDTGPSFILLPDAFQDTFASLGARMDAHLEMKRVDPTYTVRFSDGTEPLELTADLGRMQAQLEAHEPGSFQNFLAYIAEGRKGLHLLLRHIAHREWRSALSYFSLGNLPLLGRLHALSIHYRRVSTFFTSPKLRAAFTFQDMYIGLSPYDAPATFALLQATEFCDEIGYPVICKAAFGGGGRGMRVVRNAEELGPLFTEASNEAEKAFGDGSMFIERYVDSPRHIEIQILSDGTDVIHLFERDCSVQRRHQKVVEVAPSVGLPDDLTQTLYADAVRICKGAGCVDARTRARACTRVCMHVRAQ